MFFLPLVAWFLVAVLGESLATTADWIIGIVLGLVLNYVGILKLIEWLGDRETAYIFPQRCMINRATGHDV
jgi:hypothetical protein